MIRQIFFDFGLTLVHNDVPKRYREILNELGYSVSLMQVEKAYHMTNKYYMREKQGELGRLQDHLNQYLSCICSYIKVDDVGDKMAEKIHQNNSRTKWITFPYVHETLKELQKIGYQTGLISNWDSSCRMVLKENKLDTMLFPIIISSEVGAEKPEKSIFEEALKACSLRAEECVYIGDNYYDDAIGASKVGMKCCIINPSDRSGIEEIEYPYIIQDITEIIPLLKETVFN